MKLPASESRIQRVTWAVIVAASLLSGGARADVPSDKAAAAEALFQEARALVAKGDHAAACPKFKASHELDPGYGVLFNLAECFTAVGKTASAWAAYNEAAGIAKMANQKDRVEKAEKRAAELASKLERMTVVVSDPPSGLSVKRDGVSLDSATWGVALPVDPGKHTLLVEAPGKEPWTTEAATEGPGKTVTITVPQLADAKPGSPSSTGSAAAGPSGAPTSTPPDDGRATRRTIGLVAGGVGVAAVAAGAAMGALASSKWNEAQDKHCRTEDLCNDTGVALVGDAMTFATASTALFIGGGVLAAGGVTLFLLSLGGGANAKQGSVHKVFTGLQLIPAVSPSNGGVLLKGQF